MNNTCNSHKKDDETELVKEVILSLPMLCKSSIKPYLQSSINSFN